MPGYADRDQLADPESAAASRYRTGRLESDIADIRGAILALQSSVAALQIGLPDKFTPRTETLQAHADIGRRVEENGRRLDQAEARWWQLLAGALLALLTGTLALIRTLPAAHG